MSPSERTCESMLLKERWSFTQSGVPREVIKICGSSLLVRNKVYGQVTMCGPNALFSSHTSDPVPNINTVNNVSSPIVSVSSNVTSQLS